MYAVKQISFKHFSVFFIKYPTVNSIFPLVSVKIIFIRYFQGTVPPYRLNLQNQSHGKHLLTNHLLQSIYLRLIANQGNFPSRHHNQSRHIANAKRSVKGKYRDKLMKGKLKPEEEEAIPPNKLYEMKRIVADKQAYKNYLNYIIDHITL